jgi:transcriptional regulator with XRE-family HTH domain
MKLTNRDLATLLRVTPQSISNWMNGASVSPHPYYRITTLYEASLAISVSGFQFYSHMLDQETGFGTIRELIGRMEDIAPVVRNIIGDDDGMNYEIHGFLSEDLSRRIWNSLSDKDSTWSLLSETDKFDIRNKLYIALASGGYAVIAQDAEIVEYSPKKDEWTRENEQRKFLRDRDREGSV